MVTEIRSDLKLAILEQLNYGRENAITGADLAKRLGQHGTREMRHVIKDLRHDGQLIGLSIRPPYGYYLINSAEELLECMATLKGYCCEAAIARRDLKVAGRVILNPHQLNLL